MADQHIVQDWRAYFESLGPGTPYPAERLEALRGLPQMVLIIDVGYSSNAGCGLDRVILEAHENALEEARAIWEDRGRPQMWLQFGWDAPWHMPAQPRPVRGRGR
jgi:hypothetical protein